MSPIDYRVEAGVARITLDDDANRNAVNQRFCEEFARVTRMAATDPAARVILLGARGRFFSVGGDLNEFVAEADRVRDHVHGMTDLFHTGIRHLHHAAAPVVVALNGMAAGGGLSMVLTGDMILARRSAKLNSGYTRSGLTPDGGATWLLPRLVGHLRAFEIMALNETLSAEAAQALGLVTRVVDDEAFEGEVERVVAALAAMAPGVLATLKRLMREGAGRSFESQLDVEGETIARRAETAETLAILRSFLKKG
jgi:2-(1,2-epoxy-1,2-dihydrophenyl)acetyl-CoA isomerase